MNPRLRQQRSVFLLFLGACFVALIVALPIVTAQVHEKEAPAPSAAGGASGCDGGGGAAEAESAAGV